MLLTEHLRNQITKLEIISARCIRGGLLSSVIAKKYIFFAKILLNKQTYHVIQILLAWLTYQLHAG